MYYNVLIRTRTVEVLTSEIRYINSM